MTSPKPTGWFTEKETMSPGTTLSLKVKSPIHKEKTKFQDLEIFQSESHGKVMVLDGMIQLTEADECSYQEMIAHLPMFSHGNAKHVLIIGGGDGGVAREVLKHAHGALSSSSFKVTLVDIDERVIKCSEKFLPEMSNGAFKNPNLEIKIMDGFQFLKENKNTFDVIITDSSDPVGPAASLFEENFYSLMRDSLTENGVVCCQGESFWLHLDLIENVLKFCKKLFDFVEYSFCSVPTYPSGQIGFVLCGKGDFASTAKSLHAQSTAKRSNSRFSDPDKKNFENIKEMSLKYFSYNVHKASFVLPEFARKRIDAVLKD